MGQFGGDQLKDDPGGDQPGQAKSRPRVKAVAPGPDEPERCQQDSGPKGKRGKRQVIARWRAVGFLAPEQFRQEIPGQGAGYESAIAENHGDEPGRGDHGCPDQSSDRAQPGPKPGPEPRPPVGDGEGGKCCKGDERQHRPLDQNARTHRHPKGHGQRHGSFSALSPGPIDSHKRALGDDDTEQQHGVGLGDMGLDIDQQRAR